MEHRVDPWLILAVIGILGASLTTLHTVSRVIGTNLLLRQLVWGVAGLITLWLLSRVRLDVFERLAPLLYGIGLIALVAVLLFGVARGGNRAWIAIGPLTIQPSEFVRLAVILMVAAWLADRRGDRLKTGEGFVAVLLVGIPVGLIILEPDLGVALTYLPILGGALWLGGLPRTAWIILIVLAVISSSAAWRCSISSSMSAVWSAWWRWSLNRSQSLRSPVLIR